MPDGVAVGPSLTLDEHLTQSHQVIPSSRRRGWVVEHVAEAGFRADTVAPAGINIEGQDVEKSPDCPNLLLGRQLALSPGSKRRLHVVDQNVQRSPLVSVLGDLIERDLSWMCRESLDDSPEMFSYGRGRRGVGADDDRIPTGFKWSA
jgi:hypothetical protein